MLSRLPALSWASQALSRPLSTFQPLWATARPDSASGASKTTTAEPGAIDPVPAKGPDAAPHVKPGDIVAGAQAGPPTERLSAGVITAETTSGAPAALLHRQVRIYQPTKTTMQSAKGKTKRWLIDWDVLSGAGRWENNLMGWASSADYMQATQMNFRTKEDAIAFAERQGWDYQIQATHKPKIPPKNYASNYVHVPGKLRIHHTK